MGGSFDYVTLYFCTTVAAISATVGMMSVWRIHGREPAVRYWALGYLLCAAATIPFAFGSLLPAWIAPIVGNTAAIASIGLIAVGTLLFVGREHWIRPLAWISVPFFLGNLYWSTFAPSMANRVSALAGETLVDISLMVFALLRSAEQAQRAVFRFVAACWSIYGLTTLVRSLCFVLAGTRLDINHLGIPQALYMALLQATTVLTAIGHLLMASQRLQIRLDILASRDDLTGVRNRRAFLSTAAAAAAKVEVTLMVFDLDHFKRINDTYGHAAGDQVLRRVADVVQAHLRDCDLFARAGGEEFWLFLPGVSREEAAPIAERLRLAVAGQVFDFASVTEKVTISLGAAVADRQDVPDRVVEAISRADSALYAAKKGGRNRVVFAENPPRSGTMIAA